ncbi:O-acetyltransferase PaAT-1 [Fulvia fulva]|uniref:O-acetyltransferase PaAT-1 n=1 Tax=Passalora fulva TaxID=5499 RepID=A0A9Q8P4M2_PASFU|nr:O-acetyltransferase PaAT-1 [Fulvia fulva]KAK4631790.1 O-acetyltransferase PaAT-1 [Fulvia fulva]KAK4632594.1 O-acetyltransferase PaAT-1 [Fulvia fulva]UJO13230.1 O-acetyltransferase PaAT-1 [Fulvia fulva]WPV11992.1 O-acetyltransferase PaAT-1 [Fulvia fulva]WPV26272.1 O-acetyltransferase PaAT-1 [Fulvia fulva]
MLTIEVGHEECFVNGDGALHDNGPAARTATRPTPPESASNARTPAPEPWINGLRGLAALQVVIFHYITPEAFFIYESAWVPPEHPGPRILKLIPVRLLAQGDAMARLFFVLSGYCIALGFSKEARSGPSIQYYGKLTSAVFRRSLRLFIPFTVVAILGHALWFLGLYAEEPPDLENFCPDARPWASPWSHVSCTCAYLLNAFNTVDLQWTFGLHNSLWSVPLELRGSLATYTTLLGLANIRTKWRISIVAMLATYNFYYSTKDLTGFFAGLLIAELQRHIATLKRKGPLPEHLVTTLSTLALTTGLYLLSLPMKLHNDPVESLPPDYDFIRSLHLPHWKSAGDYGWGAYYLGSTMLLAGLLGFPKLRQWLSVGPLQSLGDISYSLSLVHFAVKWVCQRRILWIVSQVLGLDEQSGMPEVMGNLVTPVMLMRTVAFVVYLGVTFACASVLTIELERPSKQWAHKIEQKLSVPKQD